MKEIERKFLVFRGRLQAEWDSAPIESAPVVTIMKQSYLSVDPTDTSQYVVRVRTEIGVAGHINPQIVASHEAFLTVKTRAEGTTRDEYEYEIPVKDADEMHAGAKHTLNKRRYQWNKWDIDVFDDVLDGLIIAEIELKSEDEDFYRPDWLGEEVTHDPQYYNANLAVAAKLGLGPPKHVLKP